MKENALDLFNNVTKFTNFLELIEAVKAYVQDHPETVIAKFDPIDIPNNIEVPNNMTFSEDSPTPEEWFSFLNSVSGVTYNWGFSCSENLSWTIPVSALKDAPEEFKKFFSSSDGVQTFLDHFNQR